jgi:hypothetical protein
MRLFHATPYNTSAKYTNNYCAANSEESLLLFSVLPLRSLSRSSFFFSFISYLIAILCRLLFNPLFHILTQMYFNVYFCFFFPIIHFTTNEIYLLII